MYFFHFWSNLMHHSLLIKKESDLKHLNSNVFYFIYSQTKKINKIDTVLKKWHLTTVKVTNMHTNTQHLFLLLLSICSKIVCMLFIDYFYLFALKFIKKIAAVLVLLEVYLKRNLKQVFL